jgi:hypothetical protein
MKDNQHKDFDKFFQNKLNDRPFEFKDDFWEEMETLLPKNDTDSGATGTIRNRLFIGILLLCLIGLTGWLIYPNLSKNESLSESLNSNSNENSNENSNKNRNASEVIGTNSAATYVIKLKILKKP